jgi:hypothetical protein
VKRLHFTHARERKHEMHFSEAFDYILSQTAGLFKLKAVNAL